MNNFVFEIVVYGKENCGIDGSGGLNTRIYSSMLCVSSSLDEDMERNRQRGIINGNLPKSQFCIVRRWNYKYSIGERRIV